MVMRPEPLRDAILSIGAIGERKVLVTSPRGKLWNRDSAHRLSSFSGDLIFICGRFAGIDQRFIEKYVDEEISIGNFVVSGGELPVALICDSLLRFVPGVLGNSESHRMDSFEPELKGGVEAPLYSRPKVFEGSEVPEVLTSGNHDKVRAWKDTRTLVVDK